jgi:hypothetical protein
VDNIRLILEIEQIALPYGMALKDVKYNTTTEKDLKAKATAESLGGVVGGGISQQINKDYGIWELQFSSIGTYNNFLNFTKDLEKNLRIVDISSVEFSSSDSYDSGIKGVSSKNVPAASQVYKYNFTIKTYWLKN